MRHPQPHLPRRRRAIVVLVDARPQLGGVARVGRATRNYAVILAALERHLRLDDCILRPRAGQRHPDVVGAFEQRQVIRRIEEVESHNLLAVDEHIDRIAGNVRHRVDRPQAEAFRGSRIDAGRHFESLAGRIRIQQAIGPGGIDSIGIESYINFINRRIVTGRSDADSVGTGRHLQIMGGVAITQICNHALTIHQNIDGRRIRRQMHHAQADLAAIGQLIIVFEERQIGVAAIEATTSSNAIVAGCEMQPAVEQRVIIIRVLAGRQHFNEAIGRNFDVVTHTEEGRSGKNPFPIDKHINWTEFGNSVNKAQAARLINGSTGSGHIHCRSRQQRQQRCHGTNERK